MADDPKVGAATPPPSAPAPVSPAATPSTAGVTKPGQGTVPPTPGSATQPASQPTETQTPTNPPQAGTEGKTTLEGSQRRGPGISTDSPFRRRIRALEADLKAESEEGTRRSASRRAIISAQLAELRDVEARHAGGSGSMMTPRGNLLQAGAIQEQYPDLHLRWVNTAIEGRVDLLKAMGYQSLSGDGTQRGGLQLFGIPREQWAKGEVGKQRRTARDIKMASGGDRDAQVQELQKFFDKEGLKVDVDSIFLGGR